MSVISPALIPVVETARTEHFWHVLVVDRDAGSRAAASSVLHGLSLHDRPIWCREASSAAQAQAMMSRDPGIAVLLTEMVLETPDAGLRLATAIRENPGNCATRIILRTGQPGMVLAHTAPVAETIESGMVQAGAIDGWVAKTDGPHALTGTVLTALTAFERIDHLEKLAEATTDLFRQSGRPAFAARALAHLCAMIGLPETGLLCTRLEDGNVTVLGGQGAWAQCAGRPLSDLAHGIVAEDIRSGFAQHRSRFGQDSTLLFVAPPANPDKSAAGGLAAWLPTGRRLSEAEQRRLTSLSVPLATAYGNLCRLEEMCHAQEATVVALADLAEKEEADEADIAAHVRRLAGLSRAIARALRDAGRFADVLSDDFIHCIGLASILHDIGKISTPGHILSKPGKLTVAERVIMEQHASHGARMLERASRLAQGGKHLLLGAAVSLSHHEWFNGRGYPQGLSGEAIPLAARIVAVADVFDALVSPRPYKEPWPTARALDYIRNRAGTQFDPTVVDAFLTVMSRSWREGDQGETSPAPSPGPRAVP